MCGIAGVFRLAERPDVTDAVAVLRMLDAQVHRGPDDWGVLVPAALRDRLPAGVAGSGDHIRTYAGPSGPGAVLGSRRLAILDPSARGRMPMGDESGRVWITHSGEVYNHRELRAELAPAGARFSSATDTEVVLRGYGSWGADVCARLRGMFAFAIFEAAPAPRLLLARDPYGIKPLYYTATRDRIVFASEVRALVASGLVPDEPEPAARVQYLEWGSVPAPLTTVAGVLSLPAGERMVVEPAGVTRRRYVPGGLASGDPGRCPGSADRTRALLDDATRLQLASDVPLGIFLSGGIDSSGLVALARPHREALTTISVAFDEPDHDESRYARMVAARYGTDHREVTVRCADFFQALPRYLAALDQPTVDGVNTFFTAQAARSAGLRVALSGTGADELFLGYGHQRRVPALDRLRRGLAVVPAGARRALLAAAAPALGRAALSRLESLDGAMPASVYPAVRGLFAPGEVQALLGISAGELAALRAPAAAGAGRDGDAMGAVEALDFDRYLRDQLLRDTDVMGMAHSIEVRVPYLDPPLVEYVRGLTIRARLAGAGPKPLLRRALGDALPREVWQRPKMGFTFPLAAWLRPRAAELREAALACGWLERRAVESTWDGFAAGRVHWSRPWALAVLASLDERRPARNGAAVIP